MNLANVVKNPMAIGYLAGATVTIKLVTQTTWKRSAVTTVIVGGLILALPWLAMSMKHSNTNLH